MTPQALTLWLCSEHYLSFPILRGCARPRRVRLPPPDGQWPTWTLLPSLSKFHTSIGSATHFLSLYVSAGLWMCVCTHVFVHIHGNQKLMSGGFFTRSLLLLLRCALSPDLELTSSTGSPRDPVLCRPGAGLRAACHHTWLFTSIVEI